MVLNTQTEGRPVVVYNPVAIEREDIVTADTIVFKIACETLRYLIRVI